MNPALPMRRLMLVFAVATVQVGCTPARIPAASRAVLRITTGPPGGGILPLAEELAALYRRSLPDVTVETRRSSGAVANVEAIERADADLGIAFSDVAYLAFVGRPGVAPEPYDHLRAIAVLQLTPVHFVIRRELPLRDVDDLRGRRVGMGPAGSATALTAELVLNSFKLSLSDVRAEFRTFDESARRIGSGELDAMFDDAIYPADAIQTALRAGARLMAIGGAPVERLRHEYPFFKLAMIPPNAYPGVTHAVRTMGVDSLLVCRRDLDEGLVYDLTRLFFEALPTQAFSQDALRFMDLDQAPATPIPLHDGAARYYRERELTR
jgi:TRAP transporter TAXI family solute receptor